MKCLYSTIFCFPERIKTTCAVALMGLLEDKTMCGCNRAPTIYNHHSPLSGSYLFCFCFSQSDRNSSWGGRLDSGPSSSLRFTPVFPPAHLILDLTWSPDHTQPSLPTPTWALFQVGELLTPPTSAHNEGLLIF